MNTNIEPGCLCMDVHPLSFGKSVTALEKAACTGEEIYFEGQILMSSRSPLWRVDKLIDWGYGCEVPFEAEHALRRIDGHTEDKQTETVKEKVDER